MEQCTECGAIEQGFKENDECYEVCNVCEAWESKVNVQEEAPDYE